LQGLILSLNITEIEIALPRIFQTLEKGDETVLDRAENGEKGPLKIAGLIAPWHLDGDNQKMEGD